MQNLKLVPRSNHTTNAIFIQAKNLFPVTPGGRGESTTPLQSLTFVQRGSGLSLVTTDRSPVIQNEQASLVNERSRIVRSNFLNFCSGKEKKVL